MADPGRGLTHEGGGGQRAAIRLVDGPVKVCGDGVSDVAQHLTAEFGGQVTSRWADDPSAAASHECPTQAVFDGPLIQQLADDLGRAYPRLDRGAFHRECLSGLDPLELMARAAHIAEVMHRNLPQRFTDAAEVLMAPFGPPLPSTASVGMAPFRYLPHSSYIGLSFARIRAIPLPRPG